MIKYLLKVTYNEIIIGITNFIDFILPDLTILSPVRKVIYVFFTRVTILKKTRIRKWLRITHINNLLIWANCFINSNNLFNNNSHIIIWNDCSIWYNNIFITSSHFEKTDENIKLSKTFFSEDIKIWDNVWVTSSCTILPWTIIWDNVIIAAGSVVKWNIESGYVYWWTPAKKIRKTNWFIPKKL